MADIWNRKKRSEVMALVRSRGNRDTELALMLIFRRHRITGWRRHLKLPGTPDFAFPKHRLAVFVDGCFWHGCPKHATFPVTRAAFWLKKFATNKARDKKVNRELRHLGWRVLRIWEHQLREPARILIRTRLALSRPPVPK
jgi:DNA mismatch endonuclease (patch repair protein)